MPTAGGQPSGSALPAPHPPSVCSGPDTSSCRVPGRGDGEDSQPLSCCPGTTLPQRWAEREGQARLAGPAEHSSSFVGRAVWPERCLRPVRFPKVTARLATVEAWGPSFWAFCIGSPGVRPQQGTEMHGLQAVQAGNSVSVAQPNLPLPTRGDVGSVGCSPRKQAGARHVGGPKRNSQLRSKTRETDSSVLL